MNKINSAKSRNFSWPDLLLLLALLCICFDYRRADSDSSAFVVIMNVVCLSFLMISCILRARYLMRSIQDLSGAWIFTAASAAAGLFLGQSFYNVASLSVPMLMFIFSAAAVGASPLSEGKSRVIINITLISIILASIWKFAFGFFYGDLNIGNVRYQIISGALPILFSYGFISQTGNKKKLGVFCLMFALLIAAVSVTRTYVLVFACSAILVIISKNPREILNFFPKVLFALLVILLAVYIIYLIEPSILERWIDRLTSSNRYGFDLTSATRWAQINSQLSQMRENPLQSIFGFGTAARSTMTGPEALKVATVLGRDALRDFDALGMGHNIYVGAAFTGGIIFGSAFIFSLLNLLLKGVLCVKRIPDNLHNTKFVVLLGVGGLCSTLISGIFGGIFNDRSSSLFTGLAAGLVIYGSRFALRPAATKPISECTVEAEFAKDSIGGEILIQ